MNEAKDFIESFESNEKKVQDPSAEQEHAIELCTDQSESIVGVTGSAGTGKTFVLGRVYEGLKSKYRKDQIVLAAPTGRAAKRIEELTGIPAVTLHRLLQFPTPDDPPEDGSPPDPNLPRRHAGNPLTQKVVLVDESSMIGTELYGFLLDALPSKALVRFFGDNNQLAPVEDNSGMPAPFIDILEREPSVTLTYNFRSTDNIIANANKILRGSVPQRNPGFEIVWANSPVEALIEMVEQEFTQLDHQIIMPMRRYKNGTMRVNPSVQMRFNPTGDMLRLNRFNDKEPALAVRANDKILWIKNDYNLNIFNGEIGTIAELDDESGDVVFDIPGRKPVTIPARLKYYDRRIEEWRQYDPRKQIELGYAITTHKAQGSEFDVIIYCMSNAMYPLLNRRNFYTAVTRAKKKVILITDRRAMTYSLSRRG